LRDVLAAHGGPEFADLLCRELQAVGDDLPLSRACAGGYPRDARVLTVREDEASTDAVVATATVSFTEVDGGCGCGGTPAEKPRLAFLKVSIAKPGGTATVELIEDEPPEEF
jgi:hypothetical protein